eukprot:COSAG05_NODE_1625_length_4379_cov_5.546495_1_plen_77_part_00
MCQGFGVISQSSCASSKLTWHLRDSSKTRDQRLARSLVSTMELFEYLFSFSYLGSYSVVVPEEGGKNKYVIAWLDG